jgi:ribosomal protein L40E
MQACSKCGAENADGAKFCGSCGASLAPPPPPKPPEPVKCAKCGAELAPGAKFCTSCGTAVTASASTSQPAAVKKDDWSIGMAFEPITTVERAKVMAQTGTVGAIVIGAVALLAGFAVAKAAPSLFVFQLLVVAIYAACAWGMWRGNVLASLVALSLYAINVIAGLSMSSGANLTQGGYAIWAVFFVLFIIVPAALISGVRGSLAWSRFKREPPVTAS